MTCAELAEPQRQVAVRPDLLPKQLHMTGIVHRLQCETAFTVRKHEHVGAEFCPVPTALPQGPGKQLGRPDFAEPNEAHFAADVVLDDPIKTGSPWVPKCRAR